MKNRLQRMISDAKDSWTIAKAARDGKKIITNEDGSYTILMNG